MLFKQNNRSFKFCLLGLDSMTLAEVSKLITENGGEISRTRNSPVITFSTCSVSFDDRPVFHVNYIYECLRRGELLDLVPFKFGCQEFAGCLMSIFIRGTNQCPFVNDIGPCCSCTAIERGEHDYAQGDYENEQETNVSTNMQPATPNSPLRDSQFLPDETPTDSQFLPDGTPRDSEFLPDDTPRDSEFLPDGSSQIPEFLPRGTPPDSEFLPDESLPASQLSPHQPPQLPQIPPDRFLQKLRVLPDGLLLGPVNPPKESAPALEFQADTSIRDSEFLPDDSQPISEFSPYGSPRDSEFLPDASAPNSSQFLSSKLPMSLELESGRKNCELLQEESMSSIGTIVPESPDPAPVPMDEYPMLQIPEPAYFEELGDFSRDDYSPVPSPGGDRIPCEEWVDNVETTGPMGGCFIPICTPKESENVSKTMNRTCSQDTIVIADRSLKSGSEADKVHSVSDTGEETECEKDNQGAKVGGLRVLKTSRLMATSPIFRGEKTARKETPSRFSRDSISPTILRDESNRVKILGRATSEALRNVENFLIDSADSDETNYGQSPMTNDCERVENQSLSFRIKSLIGGNKTSKQNGEIAGPSREGNTCDDTEDTDEETAGRSTSRKVSNKNVLRLKKFNDKTKGLKKSRDMPGPSRVTEDSEDTDASGTFADDVEENGKENRVKKKTWEKNSWRSSSRLNSAGVLHDERNTMVSSTRSSDDVVSISSGVSDLSSDDEEENLPSRKATHKKTLPKKTTNQPPSPTAVRKRQNRVQQLSRNFLPWEQREMVKYLIDNNQISESRGIKVWKQMIANGYLVHRTPQSLNNNFRKSILPHIHRFPMKPESLRKFRKLIQ